jgi:glycosyltransferase involved in cell wall biosynthesis
MSRTARKEHSPIANECAGDTGNALYGLTIVCIGSADWDADVWTNQQHLMSRLAKTNRVVFVESLGLRRPQLAATDVKRALRRFLKALAPPHTQNGVCVVSPLVIPLHSNPLLRKLNEILLKAQVKHAARRLGQPDVLWSYVPQAESLIDALDPKVCVYHCVDDIAAQRGVHAESFRACEARFASKVQLVLASSPSLAQRMLDLSPHVVYVPNVCDHKLFETALHPGAVDPAVEALPRPRIIYTGAIVQTKVDFELLVGLARARPQWSFLLVGPVGAGDPSSDISALEAQPNIYLLGPRAHAELPRVLRGADAGLIPYALTELTRSVFPMKAYEYLAAGLAVMSTPLPALEGIRHITQASGATAMANGLEALLASDNLGERRLRSSVASQHSYGARLEEIAGALGPLLSD